MAWSTPGPAVRTLCGAELPVEDTEIINDGGMPCTACTARAALAAAESDAGTGIQRSCLAEQLLRQRLAVPRPPSRTSHFHRR